MLARGWPWVLLAICGELTNLLQRIVDKRQPNCAARRASFHCAFLVPPSSQSGDAGDGALACPNWILGAATPCAEPPWPNGQGVGPLIRRLRVRVPQGVLICGYGRAVIARPFAYSLPPPTTRRALGSGASWGALQGPPVTFRVHSGHPGTTSRPKRSSWKRTNEEEHH